MSSKNVDWTHIHVDCQSRIVQARDLVAEREALNAERDAQAAQAAVRAAGAVDEEDVALSTFDSLPATADTTYGTRPLPAEMLDAGRTNRMPGLYRGDTRKVVVCQDLLTRVKTEELVLHGTETLMEALESIGLSFKSAPVAVTRSQIDRAQEFVTAHRRRKLAEGK